MATPTPGDFERLLRILVDIKHEVRDLRADLHGKDRDAQRRGAGNAARNRRGDRS